MGTLALLLATQATCGKSYCVCRLTCIACSGSQQGCLTLWWYKIVSLGAGAVPALPKYASNIVSRAQKAECNTYLELAKQCGQDKTPQQLAQFAASKRQEFEQVRTL